jgi:hypothetical protein
MRPEAFDKLRPAHAKVALRQTQRALAVENSTGSVDLWMPW